MKVLVGIGVRVGVLVGVFDRRERQRGCVARSLSRSISWREGHSRSQRRRLSRGEGLGRDRCSSWRVGWCQARSECQRGCITRSLSRSIGWRKGKCRSQRRGLSRGKGQRGRAAWRARRSECRGIGRSQGWGEARSLSRRGSFSRSPSWGQRRRGSLCWGKCRCKGRRRGECRRESQGAGWRAGRSRTGREERIEADGDRVDACGWFACFAILIVNLDKLDLGELFEIFDKRLGNGIKRAVRLATAREVDMRNTVGKRKFAVAGKAI